MGERLGREVKGEDRKRRWEDSLPEVKLWDSLPEMGDNLWGGGGSLFVGARYMVWGRVCSDWEACSLYLLEVGMREWGKLGESRM